MTTNNTVNVPSPVSVTSISLYTDDGPMTLKSNCALPASVASMLNITLSPVFSFFWWSIVVEVTLTKDESTTLTLNGVLGTGKSAHNNEISYAPTSFPVSDNWLPPPNTLLMLWVISDPSIGVGKHLSMLGPHSKVLIFIDFVSPTCNIVISSSVIWQLSGLNDLMTNGLPVICLFPYFTSSLYSPTNSAVNWPCMASSV